MFVGLQRKNQLLPEGREIIAHGRPRHLKALVLWHPNEREKAQACLSSKYKGVVQTHSISPCAPCFPPYPAPPPYLFASYPAPTLPLQRLAATFCPERGMLLQNRNGHSLIAHAIIRKYQVGSFWDGTLLRQARWVSAMELGRASVAASPFLLL